MKKFLVIVITVFFFFNIACAESEITFQDIPWLSGDTSVLEILLRSGLITQSFSNYEFTNENSFYLAQNEIINFCPTMDKKYDDVCLSISLDRNVRGKIAGCALKNMILSFAYNGTPQLIAIKIDLIGSDYETIRGKIEKVYGKGEEVQTDEMISTTVWKGANNSAAMIYAEGTNYSLFYGRLDAVEILSSCLKTDPDDLSGL